MAAESPVRSWSYELENAFLKKSDTFRTPYTFKLFHSITVDRKNEFLNMFDIEPRNVADIISCSVCPSGGDFIKEIKWCLLE